MRLPDEGFPPSAYKWRKFVTCSLGNPPIWYVFHCYPFSTLIVSLILFVSYMSCVISA